VAVSVSGFTVQRDVVTLLDTPVDRVGLEALDSVLDALLSSGAPHQVITANLDFLAIARRRPSFARVLREADLVLCDGKPLQWAAWLQGHELPDRVTGTDLVLTTARLSASSGYRIFLLGATPGVAEAAGRRIEELVPGARIAGHYSPPVWPFDAVENARMVEMVRAAHIDALFVALGAPRQDEWIAEHLEALGVPLCAGVGAVFDFLAGTARRAPRWMQHTGLEWAFRLSQEPARLWRRYIVQDIPVLAALLAEQLSARRAIDATDDAGSAIRGDGTRESAASALLSTPEGALGASDGAL
jgi:exopolysaccharide biosynthesis WecB/TagA/CpsF family protein